MMKEFFAEAGHRLDCAYDGRDGLASASNGPYDLVILDVMLPVFDGLTVLQQLRRRKDLPVIMLTARVQQHDRILGLNTGADDYLPKPFDPDELLPRIRAVLRRTDTASGKGRAVLTIGNIQLNPSTREARVAGSPVELTPVEFDLLEMLMRSAGRVVSRGEIQWPFSSVKQRLMIAFSMCTLAICAKSSKAGESDPRSEGSGVCIYRSGLRHSP